MIFILRSYLLLLVLICISSCKMSQELSDAPPSDQCLYQAAIQSAMYPTEDKIHEDLIIIDKQNKDLIWTTINGEDYILVITWKSNIAFYEPFIDSLFYNTANYPIWVTVAPELRHRIQREGIEDLDRRLISLLGLPPNAAYSYFVEFWVKPQDIFRPCPDPEITDSKCSICFPNVDSTHINWMHENRIDRYYDCDLYKRYPWTQLGYTYDWNTKGKTHVGLSEFVIKRNKNIIVKAIYTTEEYLKKS